MSKITAVILDFDDTLCLTEQVCFEIENETLLKMGRKPMSRDIHLKTWGTPLFDAMLIRSPGLDIKEFRKAYETDFNTWIESGRLDTVPDKNMKTLAKLQSEGKRLVVLTSREIVELNHVLDPKHILNNHIEAFYYKDNMEYHKPDPRAFEVIEKQHGWKPSECVYVGDSVTDASSAKLAGLHFIASLESGLRKKEDFDDYTVDEFINDFTELPNAIAKLESQ